MSGGDGGLRQRPLLGARNRRAGYDTRLIAPAYVKPFVKRQKNDAADAEAICEAALRPTMRFVAVKSAEAQAACVVFRTRDLLVRQRTQTINALRGHLAEFGVVVRQGPGHAAKLIEFVRDPASDLPEAGRQILVLLVQSLEQLQIQIGVLDREIAERVRSNAAAKRLMTIPGIGPIAATALVALAPPPQTFRRGRDFAAWMGLTPLQHSSGGKQRRLLILGASSVVKAAIRRPLPPGSWLGRMLTRKPRMLVIVALANKLARIAWALMAQGRIWSSAWEATPRTPRTWRNALDDPPAVSHLPFPSPPAARPHHLFRGRGNGNSALLGPSFERAR
jgi:transposase